VRVERICDTSSGGQRRRGREENPGGVSSGVWSLEVDGVATGTTSGFPLVDDGREHRVRVVLGPEAGG
jgi:hypothetical protein